VRGSSSAAPRSGFVRREIEGNRALSDTLFWATRDFRPCVRTCHSRRIWVALHRRGLRCVKFWESKCPARCQLPAGGGESCT
jgi:hypothetical protein